MANKFSSFPSLKDYLVQNINNALGTNFLGFEERFLATNPAQKESISYFVLDSLFSKNPLHPLYGKY